jgi:hypothetical protein
MVQMTENESLLESEPVSDDSLLVERGRVDFLGLA